MLILYTVEGKENKTKNYAPISAQFNNKINQKPTSFFLCLNDRKIFPSNRMPSTHDRHTHTQRKTERKSERRAFHFACGWSDQAKFNTRVLCVCKYEFVAEKCVHREKERRKNKRHAI